MSSHIMTAEPQFPVTHGVPAAASAASRPAASRRAVIAGRVLRGIAIAFLAFDASMKVLQVQAAVEGTVQLGYPAASLLPLGLLQLAFLLLYIVPRTSVLGAVLWTGYLGGAVATHVRMGNPVFTHLLSPVYVAIVLWGGLWLTDRRLRRVFESTR
jgi:DoxX-like protein